MRGPTRTIAAGTAVQAVRPVGVTTLVAVVLGFFIVMVDTTIVNVALPQIGISLGGGESLLQWVVTGYTLAFAALLLTGGAACDALGARRVYLAGLASFALFSIVCALAPNGGVLVAARVLQGLGAAALVPGSLALLAAAYTDPAKRAKAIGIWGGAGGVAAAVGPVLGGALIAAIGWRAVFWVNVPVIVIAIWLTLRHTPNPSPGHRRRLDLPGQVLAIAALCLVTYAVIDAAQHTWDITRIGLFVLGVVVGVMFLLVEWRSKDPLLPLGLFRSRAFSVASIVGLALNLGFYGQLFMLSLYFQQYRHYGPLAAGLAMAPQAFGAIIGSPLGGRATAKFGAFPTMLVGLLIGSAGFLSLIVLNQGTPYILIALLTFTAGFGMAVAMPAATSGAVSSAPTGYAGIAGGVVNAARQTGSIVGVAVLGGFSTLSDFRYGFQLAVVGAAATFLIAAALTLATMLRRPAIRH